MDCVDCAINSVLAAKESAIRTQAAFAVEAKRLTAQKQQGEAVNQLLEAAAQLSKSLGLGNQFDALA